MPLGKYGAAVLQGRSRALHQWQGRHIGRLLRSKRGRHNRPPTYRAPQGRRVELRGGERFHPFIVRYHNQRPGRTIGLRASNRWLEGIHRSSAPRRGVSPRTKTVPTKEHRRGRQPSLAAILVSNPLELRMCYAASNTSARSEMHRTRGWMKQSIYSVPSGSLMVLGCWRTRIPVRSTLRSRTAIIGPAGGTLFAPYGFCAGTTRLFRHRRCSEQELGEIKSTVFIRAHEQWFPPGATTTKHAVLPGSSLAGPSCWPPQAWGHR